MTVSNMCDLGETHEPRAQMSIYLHRGGELVTLKTVTHFLLTLHDKTDEEAKSDNTWQ